MLLWLSTLVPDTSITQQTSVGLLSPSGGTIETINLLSEAEILSRSFPGVVTMNRLRGAEHIVPNRMLRWAKETLAKLNMYPT